MEGWTPTSRFRVIDDSGAGLWPCPFASIAPSSRAYRRVDVPFILDPDGYFDVELNAFWSDSASAYLAASSLRLYARRIAAFLDFVWYARSPDATPRTWRDVTSGDRAAYHYWRNQDPHGPRVAASTWNNEVVAINQFFEFQVAVGNLAHSPIRKVRLRGRYRGLDGAGTTDRIGELRRPTKASAPWLTPAEYRVWRDVGLRGYRPNGLRDGEFRGDQSARNAAFSDLAFGAGLRLSEQARLLTTELPHLTGAQMYSRMTVSKSVAKNYSGRDVFVSQRVLRMVQTYVESDRAEAVYMARKSGAYGSIHDALVVDDEGTFASDSGRRMNVNEATPSERPRLFRRTDDGLDPLLLWITRAGLPMQPRTWQGIFRDANRRLAKLNVGLKCNVHKLRHSWATIALAQLQRRYNKLRADAAEGAAIGDPLNWVSRRLGHRRIETTMIYIHNLEELEVDTLLELIPDAIDLLPTLDSAMVGFDTWGARVD